MTDAITREEKLMKAIATGSPSNIKPITREEIFLAKAGGQDVETPEPITRREKLLQGIIDNGGGGGSTGGGDSQLDALIEGSLTEITSNVEIIRNYAFYYQKELLTVDFPLATNVGAKAFYECDKLVSANLPKVETAGGDIFNGCVALTQVNLPLLNKVSSNMFYNCESLEIIILPSIKNIATNGFFRCFALKTLVLKSETVVTLSSSNGLAGTPMSTTGTGGVVYCPASLIEKYQQASNWSALYEAGTCNFVPIEGSEYE